jgi:hypothetical protein
VGNCLPDYVLSNHEEVALMESLLSKRVEALKKVLYAAVVVTLMGCAVSIDKLRARDPNESFIVQASLKCLYDRGVEHTSASSGTEEPRFTSSIDEPAGAAWFRQPLTLVELTRVSANATAIARHQTGSAEAVDQADDLMAFFQSNPCATPGAKPPL